MNSLENFVMPLEDIWTREVSKRRAGNCWSNITLG